MSLADDLARIELPPGSPSLAEVDRDILGWLASDDSADPAAGSDEYNRLTSELKLLSLRKKIELVRLEFDHFGAKSCMSVAKMQAMLVQGTENSVIRADEGVMRGRAAESLLPALLETILKEKALRLQASAP